MFMRVPDGILWEQRNLSGKETLAKRASVSPKQPDISRKQGALSTRPQKFSFWPFVTIGLLAVMFFADSYFFPPTPSVSPIPTMTYTVTPMPTNIQTVEPVHGMGDNGSGNSGCPVPF